MPSDKAGLKLLIRAVAPDRRLLGWTVFSLIAAGMLEAVGPLLGKIFIDDHLMTGNLIPEQAAWLLGGMLLAGWTAALIRYFTLIRMAGIAMRAVFRLRDWVHAHVLRLPMAFFDTNNSGQLLSRITNDTEQIRRLYVQALFDVLQGLTVLAGAVAAMAWLDWRLMLIVLTLMPIMALIIFIYRRLSAAAVARTRQLRSAINAQMGESIAGMAVLQATGSAERAGQTFAGTNAEYYQSRQKEIRANAWMLRPALDLVNLLLVVAAVAAFGWLPFDGLQVGLLYAFISYIDRVVEPLINITQQFSMLQQSLASAHRLDQLLAEPMQAKPSSSARLADGEVKFDCVSFEYEPGNVVLQDLTLTIESGCFFGVVGHTGAGKTTLLSLLLRFYSPTRGQIRLGGVALTELGDDGFHADVALVPQEPFLLAASARDNINMGRGLSNETIESAAQQAGAHQLITALEQGYDTPLGEGGARLSAGEKQLLAIARALAGKPRVLLLDEATARVDSATEQVVSRAIAQLHGVVTVIAIAHRLSTIRAADRIAVLNHGHLAEIGTHGHLMARPEGIYRRLYQLQQYEKTDLRVARTDSH